MLFVEIIFRFPQSLVRPIRPNAEQFLVPDFGQNIHAFVTIPSAIAEISMVLYLLVIGVKTVKTSKPEKSILAAVAMPDAEA